MTFLPAYDDEGRGPVVVLLHSGVCDRRMWARQAEELGDSFRVVRPDLRGFGETPMPPGEFSFAEDVAALLDHLGLERISVVGSSFGGQVALEVASLWPERVGRLALLCPAYGGLEPGPDVRAFGQREDELLEAADVDGAARLNVETWLGPDASPEARELVLQMQRHAFEVQLAADESDDPPEARNHDVVLERISAPTLVVSGGHDLAHYQHVARHLTGAIAGATHRHLPWAGHLPSIERPGAITHLLRDFLAAPGGPAASDT